MLEWESFLALHQPPWSEQCPISLAVNLTPEEIDRSAMTRNALVLLRSAATGQGLKLTATKNLSRAVVAEFCDRMEFPGYDKELQFSVSKVMNEPDFMPLFFLRNLMEAAKLLHRHKGHVRATQAGRAALEDPARGALPAVLFLTAFWRLDLGYFSHNLHEGWPQLDVGVVMWSLSVAVHDWETSERLTRLCTVPTHALFERDWDTGTHSMEGHILRVLVWFGLLEKREYMIEHGRIVAPSYYRKAALFDRFLSFKIAPPMPRAARH
jgi:hypothetical protein